MIVVNQHRKDANKYDEWERNSIFWDLGVDIIKQDQRRLQNRTNQFKNQCRRMERQKSDYTLQ